MHASNIEWRPDLLGAPYWMAQFPLHPDSEGEVVTSVVTYAPEGSSTLHPGSTGYSDAQQVDSQQVDAQQHPESEHAAHRQPTQPSFAFLAIHGWNDYFYQRELAEHVHSCGGRFFAIDLRKYGRSHLPGQSWGYITNLSKYDSELHVALDVIHAECGSDIPLVLYGHSTGGLTAALWADRHPGVLSALILNSPWLELQGSATIRLAGQNAIDALSRLSPSTIIPIPDTGFYHRSITGNHLGIHHLPPDAESDPFFTTGWQPCERLRGMGKFQVRAGWLRAILAGHQRVAEGLSIDVPTLIFTSARSIAGASWNEDYLSADSVLTVENIWKRVPHLGKLVALHKLDRAIHDVILSRRAVREEAFASMQRFLRAVL